MDEHDSWKKEKKRKRDRETKRQRDKERSRRNPERGCRSSLLTLRLYAIVNTLTVAEPTSPVLVTKGAIRKPVEELNR